MSPRPPATTAARRAPTHLPIITTSSVEHQHPPASAAGAARFVPKSLNRKLAPVELIPTGGRPRPQARGPFVSTTDASIAATCSSACPFKGSGCFAQGGLTRFTANRLDEAARGLTADQVITEEVRLIDGAFNSGRVPQDGARGGRDLRLHVGGDIGSTLGAQLLAGAAGRWRDRAGGAVWSFTHTWRDVPREAWGAISVLASVERPEDIKAARAAGYAAAIVVDKFPSDKAFSVPGSNTKIIPCPAETRGKTCAECRLCLDADKLFKRNVAIAFEAHGPTARQAREALARSHAATDSAAAKPVASPTKFRSVVSSNPLINDLAGLRGWISLKVAAGYLDVARNALRRSIERHVVRGLDGALEANIDGVRARKFVGRWRVKLSAAWLADAESEDKKHAAGCGTSPSRSKHAVRPERS